MSRVNNKYPQLPTLLIINLILSSIILSCSVDRNLRNSRFSLAKPAAEVLATAGEYISGVSSYYGKKFHGRKTANGETFNMYDLTAAHKTLPFGTILEVENLSNNKKVTVRINDRGPFIRNRILDLSYAAAEKIDMIKSGTAKISAKIIHKPKK